MENLEKQEKTFERHDVENTPFSIVKELPKGSCKIAIGNNIMSEKEFLNESAAKKYIYRRPWELIINTTALMAETVYKLSTTKQQNND